MRKLLLAVAFVPPLAGAQSMPFDSAANVLASGINSMFPLLGVIFTLAVVIAGYVYVTNPEQGKKAFMSVVPLGMILVSFRILTSMFGVVEDVKPEDKTPGVFSVAVDWIVSNGLVIAGALAVIGVGSFLVSRTLTRKAVRLKIKADVRELLAAIDRADEIEAHWAQIVASVETWARSEARNLPQDRVTTVAAARQELLELLAQVHAGAPLTEEQRRKIGKAVERIERCAKDADGTTVVPRDGLITQTEGNQTVVVGVQRRGVQRRQEPTQAPPAVATPHESLTDQLLNPLNPISPISIWSTPARAEEPERRDDRQECRYDPPAADYGSGGGIDSGSGSDGCSSSGSSDTGSFSND